MKKINLNIKGMHCKSCEILIKDSLEETNAVKNINISHKTGALSLEYDESKLNEKKIKTIIANEGYEAG